MTSAATPGLREFILKAAADRESDWPAGVEDWAKGWVWEFRWPMRVGSSIDSWAWAHGVNLPPRAVQELWEVFFDAAAFLLQQLEESPDSQRIPRGQQGADEDYWERAALAASRGEGRDD